MSLTKEEIQDLIYCIDLIIQYHGSTERLERIYEKLRNYERH